MAKRVKFDPTAFDFGANKQSKTRGRAGKAKGRGKPRGGKADAWRAYTRGR